MRVRDVFAVALATDPARNEQLYAWPSLLPDGRSALFTILSRSSLDEARIASLNLESRESGILLSGCPAGTAWSYTGFSSMYGSSR